MQPKRIFESILFDIIVVVVVVRKAKPKQTNLLRPFLPLPFTLKFPYPPPLQPSITYSLPKPTRLPLKVRISVWQLLPLYGNCLEGFKTQPLVSLAFPEKVKDVSLLFPRLGYVGSSSTPRSECKCLLKVQWTVRTPIVKLRVIRFCPLSRSTWIS